MNKWMHHYHREAGLLPACMAPPYELEKGPFGLSGLVQWTSYTTEPGTPGKGVVLPGKGSSKCWETEAGLCLMCLRKRKRKRTIVCKRKRRMKKSGEMGRGQVTWGPERCDEEIIFYAKHSRKPLENVMQGRGIRFTIYLFFRFYVFAFMDKSVLIFFSGRWFGETCSFETSSSRGWGLAFLKTEKSSDGVFRCSN